MMIRNNRIAIARCGCKTMSAMAFVARRVRVIDGVLITVYLKSPYIYDWDCVVDGKHSCMFCRTVGQEILDFKQEILSAATSLR